MKGDNLHRWATVLVLVVFPVIGVGGLVSTSDAGMAVPDWPTTYGYNLFLYPLYDWFFGPWDLFVEHGHRLLASLAGLLTIVVCVLAWRSPRPELRWLAGGALVLVVVQGVLGGLRVVLDERTLALIHGCVGPLYFIVTLMLWCVSSRWWTERAPLLAATRMTRGRNFLRLTLFVLFAAAIQLAIGAGLRHVSATAAPSYYCGLVVVHVLNALVVLVGSGQLAWVSRHRAYRDVRLGKYAAMLIVCIAGQFALGVASWTVKFGWPWFLGDYRFASQYVIAEKGFWQTTVVTAHGALGSLILGILTVMACRSYQAWRIVNRPPLSSGNLAGEFRQYGFDS